MPWVKGQSGNPKGRHGGKREKITAAYLNDALAVWRKHGRAALEAAAIQEPAQYVAAMTRLLPKDAQLTVTHEWSDTFLRAIRAAQSTPSVGEIVDVTPEAIPEAKLLTDKDSG